MRCPKMHATIRVSHCLANQEKRVNFIGGYRGQACNDVRYPGCKNCEHGLMAARGDLSDDDVMELVSQRKEESMFVGSVQSDDMTTAVVKDSLTTQLVAGQVCQDCGQVFEPWKIGNRRVRIPRCKACHYKKNGKEISKAFRAMKDGKCNMSGLTQTNESQSSQGLLTVDFTDHPLLLEHLENLARNEFRTPANQVLWMIHSSRFEGLT